MRLINADAFKTYMRDALEQTRNAYTDKGEWAETITEQFCEDIDEQPTIEPDSDTISRPQWIPCNERLPELDVYVIATTQWHEITMACRIGDGEWFIHEGDENAYDDDVIAWMPLPEPYQGN